MLFCYTIESFLGLCHCILSSNLTPIKLSSTFLHVKQYLDEYTFNGPNRNPARWCKTLHTYTATDSHMTSVKTETRFDYTDKWWIEREIGIKSDLKLYSCTLIVLIPQLQEVISHLAFYVKIKYIKGCLPYVHIISSIELYS